ncbi:ABC transporter permease [Patescibacteria group bacterium]|nr:ABC transporter permease [Patescibacteria group bacterium]
MKTRPLFTSSLKMFIRDKQAWIWSLFIPMFMMTVFGLMDFDQMGTVKIGIVDRAKDQVSEQLVEILEGVEILEVQKGEFNDLNSKIEKGNIDLLLIIPEKIAITLAQKPPISLSLELFYNQGRYEQSGTGMMLVDQVLSQFGLQLRQSVPAFTLDQKQINSRNLNYMDYIVPGIVGMMIMQLGIIGVAMIVVRYREREILKRLRVTPMNSGVFLLSLIFTRMLLLMAQAGLIILIGKVFFDLHLYGNLFYIFATAFLGSLVFLSIGFAISGVAKTMNTAMSMAQLIQMPMMFLSGTFFPREAFPDWLQKVTDYLPLTYLADALRETMIENATLIDVKHLLIPLVVWAMGGFFLATKLFRWE